MARIQMREIQARYHELFGICPYTQTNNITIAFDIEGRLDLCVLQLAFDELVQAQPMLRAVAVAAGYFDILPKANFSLKSEDRRGEPPADQLKYLDNLVAESQFMMLPSSVAPQMRATVVVMSESLAALVVTLNHIIADGLSLKYLVEHLGGAYAAIITQTKYQATIPIDLVEEPANKEVELCTSDAGRAEAARIAFNISSSSFHSTPAPTIVPSETPRVIGTLPNSLWKSVLSGARKERIKPSSVTIACLAAAEFDLQGTRDVLIQTVLANRAQSQIGVINNLIDLALVYLPRKLEITLIAREVGEQLTKSAKLMIPYFSVSKHHFRDRHYHPYGLADLEVNLFQPVASCWFNGGGIRISRRSDIAPYKSAWPSFREAMQVRPHDKMDGILHFLYDGSRMSAANAVAKVDLYLSYLNDFARRTQG